MNVNTVWAVIIITLIPGLELCNIDICLTWTATTDQLKLLCKISHMSYLVYFFNPLDQEQGYCISRPKSTCNNLKQNVILKQDILQNLTILTVKGHISYHLNGQWKCKHGTQTDKASINITILKPDSHIKKSQDHNCWANYVSWSLLGYVFCFVAFQLLAVLIKVSKLSKVKATLNDIEDRMYNCRKSLVRKFANGSNKYGVKCCQRSVHLILIGFVAAVAFVVGYSHEGVCPGGTTFGLVGAGFGILGAALMTETSEEKTSDQNSTALKHSSTPEQNATEEGTSSLLTNSNV